MRVLKWFYKLAIPRCVVFNLDNNSETEQYVNLIEMLDDKSLVSRDVSYDYINIDMLLMSLE